MIDLLMVARDAALEGRDFPARIFLIQEGRIWDNKDGSFDGCGNGNGRGYGDGNGNGRGYGDGDGHGNGRGNGRGNGNGNGNGYGQINET